MKNKKKKKLAVFDIDGTIFRSSLLIEVTDVLIQEGEFPKGAKKVYLKSYENWLDRKGSYDTYIGDVIKVFDKNIRGVKNSVYIKAARKVTTFHRNRVYRFTRGLVRDLKKKNYHLLAISHSPKIIVEEFCRNFGFDSVYGRVLEVDKNKKITGNILYEDLIKDKAKILKRVLKKENLSLKGSIGVGDSEADIPFLKMVERPICFNPNKTLYRRAKRSKWEVFVERKNVIHKIS